MAKQSQGKAPLMPSLQTLEEEAARRVGGGEIPHAYLEGIRAFRDANYARARRRFQSLLPAWGHQPLVVAACGHAALHEDDLPRAVDYYRRVEALGANLPDVTYNRALIAIRAGAPRQALPLLAELLDFPPPIQSGQFYLGLIYASTAEFIADIAIYTAHIYQNDNLYAKARTLYQLALEKQPGSITALHGLAEIALHEKHYLDSIAYLTEILGLSTLDEDILRALNLLGVAHYENGNTEEAIAHLSRALAQYPGDPKATKYLSMIYEKEGIFRPQSPSGDPRPIRDREEDARPIFSLSHDDQTPGQTLTIIGCSAEMLRAMRHARIAAACDSPVLLHGENGTGKELLAQLIARNSQRSTAPFLILNCASIPEVQLESELFGHEKGAFTGARANKAGLLEQANGGTLYLEEISALPLHLQGRLYRAFTENRYLPMGANRHVQIDIRLIAATWRHLQSMITDATFREDLYYLLNVISIEIPPLRERREDIPLLVEHFLRKHTRNAERPPQFPPDDLRTLVDYDWPGNVRELENLIERAVVMGTQSSLYLEEFARLRRQKNRKQITPPPTSPHLMEPNLATYGANLTLFEIERQHIQNVLQSVGNNQRQAAKILGINPSTLWRKLRSYDPDAK